MDKKLSRIMESGAKISFALLIVFAVISALFSLPLAAGELAAVVMMYLYYRRRSKKRSMEMRKYVENLAFQVDDASKSSLVNFPLPTMILRLDTGEVIWDNDGFSQMTGGHEKFFESHITDTIPGFDSRWIMEGKTVCPYDVELLGRKYNIYGTIVRSGVDKNRGILATLFWVDVTDYAILRNKYEQSRPVVALIIIDSYQELYKDLSEGEKSTLTAEIDSRITGWAEQAGGIIRRLERDRYLFVCENQNLITYTADKFSILEQMHEVKNSEGITATLSIGIGKGDYSLSELYKFASIGIDMALSRGGDQVVIKTKTAFEFYGGRTKELEKRTKVKSRVMANALVQLIRDSSYVFVMGHRFSDLDSVGAAVGVCAAVRKCGKTPYFIVNDAISSAKELISRIKQTELYAQSFITEDDAILMADGLSLVIVVDTSRPEIVEARQLLETVQRVAVIDHHRRAASYIENSAISMHEPYASSASELVAELLQYIVTPQDVLKIEAEALMAGIFLDTKSFTVKTGVRTFEAAAYLKQLGADTVEVRKLFSGNLESYVKKYQLMSAAQQIFPGISMSVTEGVVERAVASQAADELINITDIKASFVVFAEGEGTVVSARSYGQVNVQYVMEKIGGGGSLAMAGAQFADKKPDEVSAMLTEAIGSYLDDIKNEDEKEK